MLCYCHVLWKRQKETRKACLYNIKLYNNFTDLPDKHSPRFEKQSASISCSIPNEHINIVGLSSPFVFHLYFSEAPFPEIQSQVSSRGLFTENSLIWNSHLFKNHNFFLHNDVWSSSTAYNRNGDHRDNSQGPVRKTGVTPAI